MERACAACHRPLQPGVPFCTACGADIPDDSVKTDPLIGMVLAKKFRILSMLGEGGMGRVYKAEQQPLGVEVCIKTLHPHLNQDKTVVKRFFREAQAASKLRHPNCVAIYDFGEFEGTFYIAMEFLRGRSLADLLPRDSPMEPARVVKIVAQVLDVLEAAHRMQIVHRDLKPENIMIEDLATQRDFIKVLDFGIAKIVDPLASGATKLTRTGMVFGTPAYIAPEQAQGHEIDARADLYAVGVILYEMLTGELPFQGANAAVLLAKHVSEPAPPVRRKRPDVPVELGALVDGALAKDPDARPQTALAMKQVLEASIDGGGRTNHLPPARASAPARTMAIPSGAIPSGVTPVPARALDPAVTPAAAGAFARTMGVDPGAATPAAAGPGGVQGMEALAATCAQCGAPNPASAKFCGECGAPVVRAQGPLKDKFADLRRFLPSQVVDEVAQVRSRVAGEKREVVVVTLDLGGPAIHEADPEAAAGTMAQFQAAANEAVLRHGGSLERTVGEELVVLFGIPVAHADDPERGVRCALALRSLATEFNRDRPHKLSTSIGVHGGQVLVGATVTAGRPDYTPVGDAIDLAKRLAGAAQPDQILVSEKIFKWCRGSVGLRPLPALSIKGRAAAVSVFEVTGVRVSQAASGAGQLAEPALCGRRAEIETVAALAADLRTGQSVHLCGEPGAGKSRLLAELGRELEQRGLEPLLIAARPPDDAGSRAIHELVAGFGGTLDVFKQLGMAVGETRFLAPYLGAGERPRYLGEREIRAGTVAALASALERSAARVPQAVLIDDVHLGDAVTAELARRLVAAPIPRVLVVCTTRAGYDPPWGDARPSATLTLGPLGDTAIEALVEGALAPTPPPQALRDVVRARAGGSPMVALELLRSLIDLGVLVSTGGRWSLASDPAELAPPDGARALMAARVDALSPEGRFVITLAAVIGDEFSLDLVQRVAATGSDPGKIIAQLHGRGLIRPSAQAGKFTFAQPTIREVTYARLLAGTREQLHRRVAGALEATVGPNSDGREGPWELLGHHYFLGDDRDRALKYLAMAAESAIAAREPSKAVAALRKAREAAKKDLGGPDGARRNRRYAEDSLKLGEVLHDQGESAAAETVLAEGLVAARKDDDPQLIAKLRRARGRALFGKGDLDEAARELDGAMQAALGLRERGLLADLHADVGELHEKRGDLTRAAEYLLRGLELAQGAKADDIRKAALRVLNALGRVYLRWKNPDKAAVFFQQALELAEQIDDRLGAARALGNLGAVYHARSQFDTAVKFVEKSLALAHEVGDQVGVARQQHNLGTLYLSIKQPAKARASFEGAYAAARRIGWREGMATAASSLDRLTRSG